ncbi:GTP pyrophosphokinase [Bacteroides neonati]|uniref:GTP pyrophosphokinase n=1 Tax=Bacteroides neonati TaxID=1347393 RepID=UPI0004B683AB|nr:(p)ppGpp synthetase [Bacteroides neonati]
MSKPIDIQELEKEYILLRTLCDNFSIEVTRQITKLLDDNEIKLAVPIQFRTKSWDSIRNKCEQGRFTVKKTILELQDLIGIRLILLFKRDLIRVTELIEKYFLVVRKYNTEDRLEENQFGYLSIHEIVELQKEWLRVPTLAPFKELKCEIQIRTLVQHAWSEASHMFQYKNEVDVPKPLKRTIGRLSALLETVDLEFERVLTERDEYKKEIVAISYIENSKEALNVDLLHDLLNRYFPNIDEPEGNYEYSDLLSELDILNIKTVGNLSSLIRQHYEELMTEQKRLANELLQNYQKTGPLFDSKGMVYDKGAIIAKRLRSGYYYNRLGMMRRILVLHLGKSWSIISNEIKASKLCVNEKK